MVEEDFTGKRDWADKVKDILMTPADAYAEIENQATSRGIIIVMLTAVVCYMVVTRQPIPGAFGEMYMLVLGAYFGVKLGKELIDKFKGVESPAQ